MAKDTGARPDAIPPTPLALPDDLILVNAVESQPPAYPREGNDPTFAGTSPARRTLWEDEKLLLR
ncbi:predicted protein [Chaetomium globosum CBS 148.51]|uniref:Uncharacterized protein n=1 Tax=Chaetomium globosum (strain ATCC 6205 / CBS 148.51 / DSM 1962 / NBRC 6347 / NRRL 1970) TaxID=306901 RepID=Q2HBF8_CHAGB|nr:uncharacterized protein CHGG_02446 [Chaetomium globosum CBS 148.51]EAQ90511.1 predicted protein [Chaetomium globosum CBS 148.51]